jgi:peptidoglycan hydrolase-like protein with peptidoglycan-binding domain
MTVHKPARAARACVITTITAIVALLAITAPAVAADSSSTRTLRPGAGMAGKPSVQVRKLQRALERRGYRVGAPGADGRYGPLTAAAVRRLQKARGLAVDGVAGPRTFRALRASRSAPSKAKAAKAKSAASKATKAAAATPASTPAAPASTPAAPASTPPATASTPPAPASTPATTTTDSQPSFGHTFATVGLGAVLASLVALALFAAWRRRRRTRKPVEAPTDRPDTTTAAQPTAPPREPVIGYVLMAPEATEAEHDDAAARIEASCEEAGRHLLEVVCDPAVGRPLERTGLRYALGRIADGEARGLVVSDLGTFSRSMRDIAVLIDWFHAAGATLVALDLEFDTSTPHGREVAASLVKVGHEEADRARRDSEARRRPPAHRRPTPREHVPPLELKG